VRGLLCQYYRSTQTLRQHLLCRLPASSRLRRRKVAVIGLDAGGGADEEADEAVQAVQRALDGVLVCTHDEAPTPLPITEKRSEWAQLSQVMADDSAVTISAGDREYCQTEVCIRYGHCGGG
jgi:telomerase reverse transcriptase